MHAQTKFLIINVFFLFCFILFWGVFLAIPHSCGILVPQPGIEPVPPAVEVHSLNHWTAREVPKTEPFKQP